MLYAELHNTGQTGKNNIQFCVMIHHLSVLFDMPQHLVFPEDSYFFPTLYSVVKVAAFAISRQAQKVFQFSFLK